MRNKYLYSLVMMTIVGVVVVLLTLQFGETKQTKRSEEKTITVVTSFYPMYVATQNLLDGVTGIKLNNLSEPETGCLHDFQLTPKDMKLLSKADVFVVNGSGAESFLQDVTKAYPDMVTVDATKDMTDISEDVGMHAWMSPRLYYDEVAAIAKGLMKVCPKQKEKIAANAKAYREKIMHVRWEAEGLRDVLMKENWNHVILFSEAYEGLAEELHLSVTYLMDLDEERQISSGEVAEVMEAVAKQERVFILAEDPYGKSLGDMVHKQTQTPVVYIDTLTRGAYDKQRYLHGMKENLRKIKEAFDEAN
jgi:zinc transport system substrate-binding protein